MLGYQWQRSMRVAGGREGRAGVPCLLVTVTVAGCGGGGPSDAERDAAVSRWAQRTDAICRQAERDITARGAPAGLKEVDRVLVAAVADIRRAGERVRRLPVPEGAAARVRPVLAELERIDEPLRAVAEAAEVADADRLVKAAKRARLQARELERAARDAGLRVCGRPGLARAAADGVLAPVFAQQLKDLASSLAGDIQFELRGQPVDTPRQLADFYFLVAGIAADHRERLAIMEPPARAVDATGTFGQRLQELQYTAANAGIEIEKRGTVTTALRRKFDRRIAFRARRLDRARESLERVVGASAA
jgi:hypothetical protein